MIENIEHVYDINLYHHNSDLQKELNEVISKISKLSSNVKIKINLHQNLALNRDVLDLILKTHKNTLINVYYDENDLAGRREFGTLSLNGEGPSRYSGINTYMFSPQETKIFISNYNYIRRKYNAEMTINHEFTVKMAVTATNKVNNYVKQITNARINGRELTPFEKFLMAYQIVSGFGNYKEYLEDSGHSRQSRDLVAVLNSDYIVCSGYAKMLTELCIKLGINCSCQVIAGHELCSFDMEDSLYGISGRFLSDPTRSPFNYCDRLNLANVDLSTAIFTYDSYGEVLYGKKSIDTLKENCALNYTPEEVFGKPFEEYKNEKLKVLIDFIDKNYTETEYYSWIEKFLPYNIHDIVDDFLITGNLSNALNACRDLGINKERLKSLISNYVKDLEYNEFNFYPQTNAYARKRIESATPPTPKQFLYAFNNSLIAFGVTNKSKRNEIINEVLKVSICTARRGSEFNAYPPDKSLMQKTFEEIQNQKQQTK